MSRDRIKTNLMLFVLEIGAAVMVTQLTERVEYGWLTFVLLQIVTLNLCVAAYIVRDGK